MSRNVDLLIVDDNPDHEHLTNLLMAELGLAHRCHYVSSGEAALDFLYNRAPFEDAPRPRLIMLDLNMPGMGGCEALRHIKSDARLCTIPVIVLSTSSRLDDVDSCYAEHANAYIHKPADLESNLRVIREIDRFWLDVASLPS